MRRAVLAVVLFAAGCQSSSTGQVSLTPRASDATSALLSSKASTDSNSGVTLTRVRLLVNEAELRGGGRGDGHGGPSGNVSMCQGGHGGKGGRGGRVEQGPFIVDLSAAALASGQASQPLVIADVPAGTYRGSELEIEPLEKEEHGRAVADPGAAFDDFKDGSTAIVEGTWRGAAFVFKTSFEAEQESTTAITVEAGKSVALALNVDASTWFTAADGAALDPTDAKDRAAITARIQASLTIDPDAGQHHR